MEKDEQTKWLTMRQVVNKTGLKATTINRYKDDFPEYIVHRLNGQLLEFSPESIPMLLYISELYQDRSEGRRTTERVKDALYRQYGGGSPVIDVSLPMTTLPSDNLVMERYNALVGHLDQFDQRMKTIEDHAADIIQQNSKILANQHEIKQAVNEKLALLSQVAATRREEKRKGFLRRLFGRGA